jgi:3-hydroxyacyl-CoA dehydrogenase/enoyl-CoA hydratase/3-hydroxybutyryl-CoA epimerase
MAFFQTDNLWVNQLADGVAALVLDVKGRPVNVLGRQVMADLEAALDAVDAEPSFKVVILRSGKPGTFIAGADLQEFRSVRTAEDAAALSERGQRLFNRLAQSRVPTVAVIAGACLGGGLELALACDYRVVVDDPKTQLGLPEIELGLLPAWGGTQRLPRVVGLENALKVILGGKRLKAAEAVAWGLADGLAKGAEDEPPDFLSHPVKRSREGLPLAGFRQKVLESNGLGRWLIWRGTDHLLRRKVPDDMPAPWEAYRAVRTGIEQGMEAGLAYEREAAGRLAVTPACRNLVSLFFRREEARKLPEPAGNGLPQIRKVGVVGAGAMGAGIAQLAALRGFQVHVQEVNEKALGEGIVRILGLFNQAVARGIVAPADLPARLNAVHGTTKWKGFDGVDLVIEAVVEDLEAKRAVFREAEKHVPPAAVLATNTSSLRVQHLQEGLKHPGRVGGLHFFNPVHKMPLVEVVRSPGTRERVGDALMRFAAVLGKTPVLVKDSPGFVVNRVLMPYLNEAVLLVVEGVRVELVDRAMKRFGMPMGPLEVLDQVGLDVAAHIAEAMKPTFGDRFALNPAFALLKERGWLGLKSGRGFYTYRGGRRLGPNRGAESLLRDQLGASSPYQLDAAAHDELMATGRGRMVPLMVNEAAACLGEGLAAGAEQIDLAMVLGTGWAPHRGGPLQYGADVGYGSVVAALEELVKARGQRFEPVAELRRLAAQNTGPAP